MFASRDCVCESCSKDKVPVLFVVVVRKIFMVLLHDEALKHLNKSVSG